MWQVVEIGSDGLFLRLQDRHLLLYRQDEQLAKIYLPDVASVIYHGNAGTLTTNLIIALAEENIPLIICDKKYLPISMTLGTDGHYHAAKRIDAQAHATLSLKKRLWKQIIKQKIAEQARSLKHDKNIYNSLMALSRTVLSGDSDNKEARAARIMWKALMGKDFKRDRNLDGLNASLNYGYIVLRSAMARSIVSAGLHPSLSLHHKNSLNAFCLVDDMLEPFRPLVDRLVAKEREIFSKSLDRDSKSLLSGLINQPISYQGEEISMQRYMHKLCAQLAEIYLGDRKKLHFEAIETVNAHALRL